MTKWFTENSSLTSEVAMTPLAGLSPRGRTTLISRLQRISEYPNWSSRIADVDHWLSSNIGLDSADCAVVAELLDAADLNTESLGRDELMQLLAILMNGHQPPAEG